MAGFGDAIKNLYSQFILRDVLSFITPGAIVVLTAFVILLPEPCLTQRLHTLLEYSRNMHWLLYIPLFGLFFMVGFAVQCFGELFGLIRIHRIAQSSYCQRFKIFGCNWACKRDKQGKPDKCDEPDFIWWKEAYKAWVKFHITTEGSEKEWARLRDERFVVLLQMCGNGFLAIVIAGVFLAANCCSWQCANVFIVSLTGFLLLASLFWGHRVHVLRQAVSAEVIMCQLQKNERKNKQKGNKES